MNFIEAVKKKKENLNNDVYRESKPEYTLSCKFDLYHRHKDEVINLVFDDIEANDWVVVDDDWNLAKYKWSKFSSEKIQLVSKKKYPEVEHHFREEDVKKCKDLIISNLAKLKRVHIPYCKVCTIINKRFGDL